MLRNPKARRRWGTVAEEQNTEVEGLPVVSCRVAVCFACSPVSSVGSLLPGVRSSPGNWRRRTRRESLWSRGARAHRLEGLSVAKRLLLSTGKAYHAAELVAYSAALGCEESALRHALAF